MVDRYTKVCLTVIAVSLAVIGLRGLPMVGPAHADLDNYLEPVGTYQLAALHNDVVGVLNTWTSFVSKCLWYDPSPTTFDQPDKLLCTDPSPADLSRPAGGPSR